MRENNNEPTEHHVGVRSNRYDNDAHHDSATNEASHSSSKKHSNIRGRVVSLSRKQVADEWHDNFAKTGG